MTAAGRRASLALIAVQCLGASLILGGQIWLGLGATPTTAAAAVALLVSLGLLWAAWRGAAWAGPADVAVVTLLVGLGTPEPFVTKASALIVMVPAALALILAPPPWIVGSMLGTLLIYSLRGGPANGFVNAYVGDARTLGTVILLTASMFASRRLAEAARRRAEGEALRAGEALARAEAEAERSAAQAAALAARSEEQARLLALVELLETPAIAVGDGALLAPLVGRLDPARLERLTRRLLSDAASGGARLVIIDVTGVPEADADSARGLVRATEALRLLGCEVVLTGLGASVARRLTEQGARLDHVATLRSPQDAIERWSARG